MFCKNSSQKINYDIINENSTKNFITHPVTVFKTSPDNSCWGITLWTCCVGLVVVVTGDICAAGTPSSWGSWWDTVVGITVAVGVVIATDNGEGIGLILAVAFILAWVWLGVGWALATGEAIGLIGAVVFGGGASDDWLQKYKKLLILTFQ